MKKISPRRPKKHQRHVQDHTVYLGRQSRQDIAEVHDKFTDSKK